MIAPLGDMKEHETKRGGKRKARRPLRTEKVGNVIVKIYRQKRCDGKWCFRIADYTGGERRMRTCATLKAAQKEAKDIANKLAAEEAQAAQLRSADAAAYGRARMIRPCCTKPAATRS